MGNKYGHYFRGGVWFEIYNGSLSRTYSAYIEYNKKNHLAELKLLNPLDVSVSTLRHRENLYPFALRLKLDGERITLNKTAQLLADIVDNIDMWGTYDVDEEAYASIEYTESRELREKGYDSVLFKYDRKIEQIFYVGPKSRIRLIK